MFRGAWPAGQAHVLATISEKSAMLAKSLERNAASLLRKYGRGKRMFNHESGLRATMCPDRQDGLSSLLCIYLSHAQRSMDYKMDIRDKVWARGPTFVLFGQETLSWTQLTWLYVEPL